MPNTPSRKSAANIVIGLVACWFVSPQQLAAQSSSAARRVLVVVSNSSDAECVQRVGGDHVQVEALFAAETGAEPSNYEACDKRARKLLEFRLFVFRADADCPAEGFWRERMTGANPRGQVHRLSLSRLRANDDCEHMIQQATDIHAALASLLPEHAASLDANLKSELQRLHMLRLLPSQYTLRE
ncbi:MAG: metal ABC transporter substrate-binding protein [Pirellulales bacterium]|nr:metal ABC transporter substrate-binding protein [Pirellulales bacterium]